MSDKNKHLIDGVEPKYYARIPNMAIDDLPYAELALYTYYKRVAYDTGSCWQSTATVAKSLKMSPKKLRATRDKLVERELISVQERKTSGQENATKIIKITNIWAANIERYTNPPVETCPPPDTFVPTPLSKRAHKEEPIRTTKEENKDLSLQKQSDAVAADECIIHDDCLHYDNGCKMAQTGFKLLGDCNGCNAYHKRPDVDNGDGSLAIELGSDGRLTEESWRHIDATTDSYDGKCVVCQGVMDILGRVRQIAPDIFVHVHCGFWCDRLSRDDTPPALTAEQSAVLKRLDKSVLGFVCVDEFDSSSRDILYALDAMCYASNTIWQWHITPTGHAALEAWQANQPPPMADVMRACMPKPANVAMAQQTEVDEPPPEPKAKKKRKAKTPCAKCESKTRKIVEDGKCWDCCGYPDRAKMIELIYEVLGWPKTKTMYNKKNMGFMTRLAQWGATLEKLSDYAHWMKQYYDDKNWTLPFGSFNKEDMWHIFNTSDNDDDDGLPYGNAPLFADPIPVDPAIVAEAAALSKEEVAALEIKVRKQITGK